MSNIILDDITTKHNRRVEEIIKGFIEDYPGVFKYEKELIVAARIHDIGKTYIPQSILSSTNKLSPKEREIIDWHSYYSYELAKEQGYSDVVCQLVLLHHGEDKPKKVTLNIFDDVKQAAEFLRVVDAYDALTSKRSYHNEIDDRRALDILSSSSDFKESAVSLLKDWPRRKEVLQYAKDKVDNIEKEVKNESLADNIKRAQGKIKSSSKDLKREDMVRN